MSKYFTQFEESTQTIGTNLVGWTVRNSSPSYAPAYGSPTVVPMKRRYLALQDGANTLTNAISWDTIDADANRAKFDLVIAFAVDLTNVETISIFARGTAYTDWYRARITLAGGIQIDKRVASADTSNVNAAGVSFTWSAGKSYFVRFRGNSTTLQVRAWDAALGMAGEPTTWNITTTDASLSGVGWVGLGCSHATLTGKTAAINFLAVGTNGDSAVCPRTNAEYSNWLDSQNALRCVLAEMSATGYDSSASPYTKTVNVYLSNHGYTSQQQDSPATRHYDNFIQSIPTFSREMSTALSGQTTTGFGDLIISNPGQFDPGTPYLLLDGSSGCYASTPDTAANSITGDIELQAKIASDDWGGNNQAIISKWVDASQRSFRFEFTAGVFRFYISTTGADSALVSVAIPSLTDGAAYWLKVTRAQASGDTKFYYSIDERVTWTQIGATQVLSAGSAIFNSTSTLSTGAINNGTAQLITGKIYRAMVYSGIAGSLVADFNLTNVAKGATSFSAPTGETWTINGTAKITYSTASTPGLRDAWLRMKWNRNYLKMYLGDPSWPKHDFRLIIYGRVGVPNAPTMNSIRFPIADLSDIFNTQLSARFTSGLYQDQYKPVALGYFQSNQLEPPLTKTTPTIEYTLHDGPVVGAVAEVYDNQVLVWGTAGRLVNSVVTATDICGASGTHGMVTGYRFQFTGSGTPPTSSIGALTNFTNYWAIVTDTTHFKIANSLANALAGTALDLTVAGGLDCDLQSWGWTIDDSTGVLTMAAQPAGRITVGGLKGGTAAYTPSALYDDLIFTRAAVSQNLRDATSFTALSAAITGPVALFYDTNAHTVAECLVTMAPGSFSFFGVAPDGLVQVGAIGPPGTVKLSLTDSDVIGGSLHLVDTIRPIDFTKATITYYPMFFTGGPFSVGSTAVRSGKTVIAGISYGAAAIPLDSHPDQMDSNKTAVFDTVHSQTGAGYVNFLELYKKTLGVFEFETRLSTSQLNIGDTISLTHPRLGWKIWTAGDPASPDNVTTIDDTKAVVIGINTDLNNNRCKLKVFRPITGYYPTADLN